MVRKYYTFIRNKNITILGIIKNMPWYKKEAIKKIGELRFMVIERTYLIVSLIY